MQFRVFFCAGITQEKEDTVREEAASGRRKQAGDIQRKAHGSGKGRRLAAATGRAGGRIALTK